MAKSNFIVRGGADFSGINKEFAKMQNKLTTFQQGLNKTMKVIGLTLSGLAIGKLAKDSTKAAMSVESAIDNISRNMGNSAEAFEQWVKSQSKALGMAQADAYRYGSTFSNLLASFSNGAKETANNTQELMKAAAIIASKTGRTYEDTAERIRSGLLGSTEAIEDLGVYTNISMIESTEAFRKFAGDKSWAQLDFQTQQQIRLAAILEQTYKRYGDTLADTTQTRHAQFIASLQNIKLLLGQVFLPIYNAVLPALTAMANAIERVVGTLAAFTQALFGKATTIKSTQQQTKATQAQTGAVEDLGDATEKAGKQAKGALSGFDELNTLMIDTGGAAGGVATGEGAVGNQIIEEDDGASGAIGEIANKATEMATKVRETFTNMKNAIVENKDIIVTSVGAIGGAFAAVFIYKNWPSAIGAVTAALTDLGLKAKAALAFLVANPVWLLVAAIGALIGVLVTAYLTNDEFRAKVDALWNRIKTALTPALQKLGEILSWVWQNVLVPLGQFLADVFVTAWNAVTVAAQWLWENVLVPFGNFLLWLWNSVFVPIGNILLDILGVAFQTVSDIAKSFWENVLVPLGNALVEMFGPAVEAVSAVLSFLWNSILVPLGDFLGGIFKGIIETLINVFTFLWQNVLKPIAEYVGGVFADVFDTVFRFIGDIIEGLKDIFIGLMNFITGVFTGDWEKAWEGVRDIFKGIFDTLYGFVKVPLNLIIDAINTVIGGLNKLSIKIPDWVPGLGGKSWGINIPKIPRLAKGGITNGPMLAMIGDNPGGREVVSPLDDLVDMIQTAVNNVVATNNSASDTNATIILQIGETELGRTTIKAINKYQRQVGRTLLEV